MQLIRNTFTIADLNKWLEERTLIVNHNYQRLQGLWHKNARSYFIDTILNNYPFPKITIRQTINLKTRQSIREIIDGQQRMMTINDFVNNKLTLSSVSELYKGQKFSDLDEDIQSEFLAYEISVDTLVGMPENEILEIFRRINSYTLPLNASEKRHASYQGEFKWFIKNIVELYTPMFKKYKILSVKKISRMADADLMTELCQILMKGIMSRNKKNLDKLYKNNDNKFQNRDIIKKRLKETLDFIKVELNKICENEVLKSYSFYSLFSALIYNKWGIYNITSEDVNGLETINEYINGDIDTAIQTILELFSEVDSEVDSENETIRFGEFVKANKASTNNIENRKIRLKYLVSALQNKI